MKANSAKSCTVASHVHPSLLTISISLRKWQIKSFFQYFCLIYYVSSELYCVWRPYQYHDRYRLTCPGSLWPRPHWGGWWDEEAPSTAPFLDPAEGPDSPHSAAPGTQRNTTFKLPLPPQLAKAWMTAPVRVRHQKMAAAEPAVRPFLQPTPDLTAAGSPFLSVCEAQLWCEVRKNSCLTPPVGTYSGSISAPWTTTIKTIQAKTTNALLLMYVSCKLCYAKPAIDGVSMFSPCLYANQVDWRF